MTKTGRTTVREVSVLKKEKDSDRTLEGAIFGLFAKEDIKSETTERIIEEQKEQSKDS